MPELTPVSDDALRALVDANPGQATFAEYRLLRDRIRAAAPGNVLVFGVGRDSPLWIRANEGGRTVFLEDVPEWIRIAREKTPEIEVVEVAYSTRRFLWRWLVRKPGRRLRMAGLPDWIRELDWDLILVDAPQGQSWKRPGRMSSIWEASRLARSSGKVTDVLVHDCHRAVEATCADLFLGRDALASEIDHMRHYRIDARSETSK